MSQNDTLFKISPPPSNPLSRSRERELIGPPLKWAGNHKGCPYARGEEMQVLGRLLGDRV